ncbi:uncharacterized protein LOC103521280, partial [Diaphorina citri]|uniref:Uncharacterized protein LOC103521280 n=1 Tax=Diaphorina citri TaxID=121845 RepID=A0A1S3DM34_DIACI
MDQLNTNDNNNNVYLCNTVSNSYSHRNDRLNELSIYYQNCRGLRTKQNEFTSNFVGTDFDVICLTETWLKDSIFSSSYFITNDYYVYRKDRLYNDEVQFGGGVLIAVKKHFNVVRLFELDFDGVDCVWVKLKLSLECELIIGNSYIPGSTHPQVVENYCNFLLSYESFVDSVGITSTRLLLLGDFNLPLFDWAHGVSLHYDFNVRKRSEIIYSTFVQSLNLVQHNYVRINEHDNLLDLVLSNLGDLCDVTDTGGFSFVRLDHEHPALNIAVKIPLSIFNDNFQPFVKKNYARGDYFGLYNYLRDYQYTDSEDVDVLVEDLSLAFHLGVNEFIPDKVIRPSRYPGWFSRELIYKLRLKERLHRKCKRAPYNLTFKDNFSSVRKQCKKLYARDLRKYHDRVESDLKANPKFFWRFAKLKYKGTHEINIFDGNEVVPTEQVPNKFAEHFHSIYNTNSSASVRSACTSDDQSLGSVTLDLPRVEECDVILAAKELKSSFVCGVDDDLKIGRHVAGADESRLLQNDINAIVTWCT